MRRSRVAPGRTRVRRVAAGVAVLLALWGLPMGVGLPTARAAVPPLRAPVFDAQERSLGVALIYRNYVELQSPEGTARGAVGVVWSHGRALLFLVGSDAERRLIGWAENYRIYNPQDELVGYYFWTPIWSYVYDPDMKKVGQAQCLAYQGVCAAGIAGLLLELM